MEKDLSSDFTVVFGITPLIFYDSLLRGNGVNSSKKDEQTYGSQS